MMKPKKKPNYKPGEIQKEYLEHSVAVYRASSSIRAASIRAAARELKISPMKLRKILITEGIYDNAMSQVFFASTFSSKMQIELVLPHLLVFGRF